MKQIFLFLTIFLLGHSVYAQKAIHIALLADELNNDAQYEQLKQEIRSVLGSRYSVQFDKVLQNNYTIEQAKQNYESLNPNEVQLIIATGVTNAVFFYQQSQIKIPTIIIGGINKDLIKLPVHQKTSEKDNINYIILPSSYGDDLDEFNTIFQYKKVGIIIHQNKINSLPITTVFNEYFKDKTSSYKLIPMVNNTIDTSLLAQVDAVYMADGFNLNPDELSNLVQAINTYKRPSFSANGVRDVKAGVLASNKPQSVLPQLIRKIALHTESIAEGTNPSTLPLFIDYNNQLTINNETLNKIGLRLKYSLLGTANIIGSSSTNVHGEKPMSLKTIMHQVLNKNLSLTAEKQNILLSEQDVKTSKSTYLPDVSSNVQGIYLDPEIAQYSSGSNPEFETKGNIELKQLLYSADASAGIKINKKLNEAQKATYNAAELDGLLNASSAYFNALILKTNLSIQNQNLQVTKQNLEFAKQNLEAGSSGKTDVLRFRSQLAQNTQSVIEAGNQLKQIQLTINQLRNAPLRTKFDIEDADIAKGLYKAYNYQTLMELLDSPLLSDKLVDFFIEEAKKNAPEVKNIDLNIEATNLNLNLNKTGRYIPTVALAGQYNYGFTKSGKGSTFPVGAPNLPKGTYNAAVNISLPLFSQNTRNIKQETALIQTYQLNIQRENILLNIEKNIQDVVLELMNSIANIEISKVSEETAKESLELAQVSYQSGAIPVIQLIDAQTNYLQAQLGSSTAKYKFLSTSFQLERFLGHFFIMQTEEENQAFFNRAQQFIINK